MEEDKSGGAVECACNSADEGGEEGVIVAVAFSKRERIGDVEDGEAAADPETEKPVRLPAAGSRSGSQDSVLQTTVTMTRLLLLLLLSYQ